MTALILILFLIGLPAAELFVMVKTAMAIGVLPVIFASIGTAVLGGYILKAQGFAALRQFQEQSREGRTPVEPAAHGVLLLAAAPLLMTPGFITDAVGFLLLIPAVRREIARRVLLYLRKRMERGEAHIYIHKG